MERKTKVHAEAGKQEILVTREFDLPVELLFRAHVEADLVAQWMHTRVLEFDARTHGGWRIETSDPQGNVVVRAHGVFHDIVPNKSITRTFEMAGAFDVQLQFLQFEPLGEERSKLTMEFIFRTPELRDEQLKQPFVYGINMAHDALQNIVAKLK